MINTNVRKMEKDDVAVMVEHIREADRQEIIAEGEAGVEECLQNIYDMADEAYVGIINGEVVCIFGCQVIDPLGGLGVPWMLSTHYIEKHPIAFLRQSKKWAKILSKRLNTLINFVDNRYDASILWLKWLGFKVEEPEKHGKKGALFRRFKMEV